MKINLLAFTFIISVILCAGSCSKCEITDWIGSYVGKDTIDKTSNNGTTVTEQPVDVNVEIIEDNGSSIGNNLKVEIKLFYSVNDPTTIVLLADATCEDSFTFRDKAFFQPSLIDANGNKFTLEYMGATGSYLNDSKDVQIVMTEKKIYDNPDLENQNYTAVHTIKLNKQ